MKATAEGRPTVGRKPANVCVNAGLSTGLNIAAGHLLAKTRQLTNRNPIEADDSR